MIDETHDVQRVSWVDGSEPGSDFPVQNLPLGIFSEAKGLRRPGVAIGDYILDLAAAADLLDEEWRDDLSQPILNAWLSRGSETHRALRGRLSEILTDERYRDDLEMHLIGQSEVRMHVPCLIGDYTDFYVGIHHARNVGRQFRPDNPLLPNYKYVPIGYHGRASSVRPSGEPVVRPSGQRKPTEAEAPEYGPSRRLDYELELGIWIGRGNDLGQPISIGDASGHIAGYCLLNDWSARDLQAWEYQPLGPFLAKNFLTSVSPWVVGSDALEPFRSPMSPRADGDPAPLPYLDDAADRESGGAQHRAGGHALDRQDARAAADSARSLARAGGRGNVLERRADRDAPCVERLQPSAGGPDRDRDALHRQGQWPWFAAGDQPRREAAGRTGGRRNAQLPGGWRRDQLARLVRA
jgi:fumarylacetoacetase